MPTEIKKWRCNVSANIRLLFDKNSFATSHSKIFSWTPAIKQAPPCRDSPWELFLWISRNSQENTCAEVSSFQKNLLKSDSSTDVSRWILQTFYGCLSCRKTRAGLLPIVDFFLGVFRKFQKIFESSNELVLLVYIAHAAILKGSYHHQFN